MYWGRGIHYRGCTFIAGGVHTRAHVYRGRGIHYRGCTFIAGGVHTRAHVYRGRGIHYRGCTFIAGGVHTRMHVYWGRGIHYRGCTPMTKKILPASALNWTNFWPNRAHWLVGFPILRRRRCTGNGFITGGVHTRTHVYWGWHPLQGVYLHNWGVASTSAASTTGGVPSSLGGVHTRTHVYWGVYLHCN